MKSILSLIIVYLNNYLQLQKQYN